MIKLKKSSTHEGYKPRGSFITQFTVEDISHHTLQRHQYIKQNNQHTISINPNSNMNQKLIYQIINEDFYRNILMDISKKIEQKN